MTIKLLKVLPLLLLASINVYAKDKPLNILYIMSDDHTSNAIGAYKSRLASLNPTPTIDSLAKEGIVFKNAYCSNAICTPSRATIITGQYSHTNGALDLGGRLEASQLYLSEEIKKQGYQTAVVGKWHVKVEPKNFDYYCVLPGQGDYFDPTFYCSDIKKPYGENILKTTGHSSDIVTDISLKWLRNRDKTKPFFLMHHYKAPHDMFKYAPRYEDYLKDVEIPLPENLYDNKKWGSVATRGENDSLRHIIGTSISHRNVIRSYYNWSKKTGDFKKDTYDSYQSYLKKYLRCVKGVDDNLVRIFDYLKSEGLWDNTIIVYTADQGMFLGEHDFQDKRWMYNEAMQMPFIIKHPNATAKGVENTTFIGNVDFAPTLIDLAGGKVPEYMEGRSFKNTIFGKKVENERECVYFRYWMHMVHHYNPAHIGIRTKDYKLILFYGRHYKAEPFADDVVITPELVKKYPTKTPTPVGFELYDVKNDPFENVNLAQDPKYADVLKDMKQKLKQLRIEVGDTDEKFPELKKIIDKALN